MRVEVRPLYVHGKPLRKDERLREPPSRGKLSVVENRLDARGRVVTCATLTNERDGLDSALLPQLTDVQLIWISDESVRLRGLEQIDGALFGQTWDIKVL